MSAYLKLHIHCDVPRCKKVLVRGVPLPKNFQEMSVAIPLVLVDEKGWQSEFRHGVWWFFCPEHVDA